MSKKFIKFLCCLMVMSLYLSISVFQTAADESIAVEVNGKRLSFDVEPVIINNIPMIPMRTVFEELGAVLEWNGDNAAAWSLYNDHIIIMRIGDSVITVNNESVTLETPPVITGDRTLIPVSAVPECLNAEAVWNEETNTVIIKNIFNITSADEFINTLGSNRTLILKEGVYDFSEYPSELSISGVNNLTIIGADNYATEFITANRFRKIINFSYCNNIEITNIKAGHTPQEYECDAGVFEFNNCTKATVSGCFLYGCGSEGIIIRNCSEITTKNTVITDCSLRAVYISNSNNISFDNVSMIENRGVDVINLNNCTDITFKNCKIENNKNIKWSVFEASGCLSVVIKDSVINNNSMTDEPFFHAENICVFLAGGSPLYVQNTAITNNNITYELFGNIVYEGCVISGNTFN